MPLVYALPVRAMGDERAVGLEVDPRAEVAKDARECRDLRVRVRPEAERELLGKPWYGNAFRCGSGGHDNLDDVSEKFPYPSKGTGRRDWDDLRKNRRAGNQHGVPRPI